MKITRPLKAVFLACLALIASAASAQTIYKQVDEDGKVIFTDQPRQSARTVASYPIAKLGNRRDIDSEASESVEPLRRHVAESPSSRAESDGRGVESQRWINPESRTAEASFRSFGELERASATSSSPETGLSGTSPNAGSQRGRYGEIERAVTSYTSLNTSLAAQVDANEAARRARQETRTIKEAAPVLLLKPAPTDHDRLAQKGNLEFFYAVWVLAFILMAGGLLYFGWRVLELILGRALPRWRIGTG